MWFEHVFEVCVVGFEHLNVSYEVVFLSLCEFLCEVGKELCEWVGVSLDVYP